MNMAIALKNKMTPLCSIRFIGLLIFLLLLSFGLGIPYWMPGDPFSQDLHNILRQPGDEYISGTDHLGREMILRLAAAIRMSLTIAFVTTGTAALVGTILGILAALKGGVWNRLISFGADIFLALPGLLLVILFMALAPGTIWALYCGITLVLWVEYYQMTYAVINKVVNGPAVQASRLLGFGSTYIFFRHLWPELKVGLPTVGMSSAATAIICLTTLGFINIGVTPPTPELGQMIVQLLPYYNEAPLIFIQPVIAFFLLVLSLNFLSGGKIR